MQPYQFGVREDHGRLAAWDRELRYCAAESHDCEWTEYYDAAKGVWRSWFSTKNLGSPFNERAAAAVLAELPKREDA